MAQQELPETTLPYEATPSSQDEAVYEKYLEFGSLVSGGRVTPNWLPDGSSFWYAQGTPDNRQVLRVDPASNSVTPFFDVPRLRRALRNVLGFEPLGRGVPFERFQFVELNTISFMLDGQGFLLNLERYALSRAPRASSYSEADLVRAESERAVPGSFMRWKFTGTGRREASPEVPSPDGRWIASIEQNDLALRSTHDGQTVRITSDGTPDSFWDLESFLWSAWSPDGQHLAIFRQHTDGMPRVPVIEWLKPREQAKEIIALPAGGALNRSELYLVDLYSQRPVRVDLADTTNQYLRILTWRPDSSELFISRYDRCFRRAEVQAVDVGTGRTRALLSEESATFLSNHHTALWSFKPGFTLLPDASGFLWQSERSGFEHLYYHDPEGRLIRQLTHGEWRIKDVLWIDPAERWVYFSGHGDPGRPYDTHLYRVNLSGEGFAQLTEGKGQHVVQIAPSGKYFTDTYSAVDVPSQTVLRTADGALIRTLGEADISDLQTVGWTPPKEYVVKAADGITDLWVTMYFPYNFDPNKRYPLIEHIYGGPQSVWRPLDFADQPLFPPFERPMNFNRALANLGFIVVILDARGTPDRSKAFHDVVYGQWGQFEIADHAGALRQLGSRLRFIDLERVGVWGLSWGGQFAFRALAQAPDLYKVGICEVPALDPRRMNLYEPYLGLPQQNKSAYAAADPFPLVSQVRGELLLVGGLNDAFTPADLFKLSEALVRLGKQHRMMAYPNSGHVATGKTAEYNMELKKGFLIEHLFVGGRKAG